MLVKRLCLFLMVLPALFAACSDEDNPGGGGGVYTQVIVTNYVGSTYIADYTVAKDPVLRRIPAQWIDRARTNLHVAYQHTSHGTHVAYGLYGLPGFKAGDDVRFGICSPDTLHANRLEFHDYALSGYAAPGVDAADLSREETAFYQATRNFLNDPANNRINVVMWSWCSIAGHDVSGNYLPGMAALIGEYGTGGPTPGR